MSEKPVKKLFIQTHGCQMNEYDSSRIRDLLGDSHQLVATDDPAEADDFPEGMVLSELRAVEWSEDGSRVFVGIKEQESEEPEPED